MTWRSCKKEACVWGTASPNTQGWGPKSASTQSSGILLVKVWVFLHWILFWKKNHPTNWCMRTVIGKIVFLLSCVSLLHMHVPLQQPTPCPCAGALISSSKLGSCPIHSNSGTCFTYQWSWCMSTFLLQSVSLCSSLFSTLILTLLL